MIRPATFINNCWFSSRKLLLSIMGYYIRRGHKTLGKITCWYIQELNLVLSTLVSEVSKVIEGFTDSSCVFLGVMEQFPKTLDRSYFLTDHFRNCETEFVCKLSFIGPKGLWVSWCNNSFIAVCSILSVKWLNSMLGRFF